MINPRSYIAYTRVSTQRQGASGLGLEAQQSAVRAYLDGTGGRLIDEFQEVESGGKSDRPELARALHACRVHGATLLIAKLDRLARDAHFLLGLEKAGIEFVACDMPSANRLTVGIMALVAEEERRLISVRTKAALAAAKARGVRLGGDRGNLAGVAGAGAIASVEARQRAAKARAMDLKPIVESLVADGRSTLRQLADGLNKQGIKAPRGGTWSATQVGRLLELVQVPR